MIINRPLTFKYVDDPNGGYGTLVELQTMEDSVLLSINTTSTVFGKVTDIIEHKNPTGFFIVNKNHQRLHLRNVQVYVENTGWRTLDTSLVGESVLGYWEGKIVYAKLHDITANSGSPEIGYQINTENNIGFLLSSDVPLDFPAILIRES